MKFLFGFLAIYLWLGILFAIFNIVCLRKTSNQEDYKVICAHPAILVFRWPDLLFKLIILIRAYRKIQYFKKLFEEAEAQKKENYSKIVKDKTRNMDERLNALVELGAMDYSFEEEN